MAKSVTSIYDQRVAAEGQGVALGQGSKLANNDVLDLSGLNTGFDYRNSSSNKIAFDGSTNIGSLRGAGVTGSASPSGDTFQAGDLTLSVVTNNPAAAIAALEQNSLTSKYAIDSLSTSQGKTQDLLEKATSDSISLAKDLALPADERQFSTTTYVVGAIILVGIIGYTYYKVKK